MPVPTPDGGPSHWVMIQRDVTDRREADEGRRRSEERLQAVFDGTQAGIMVCDADGRFLQVNPGLAALLGYSEAELAGLTLWHVTHPDDVAAQRPGVADLFAGRRDRITIQKRYVRKDGSTVWADLHATPVRDAAGRVTHAVGVAIDITERRRLEDQLRQAQKMEAIGQMAGGVAHDFNNLLTAVLGNLALVRLPPDDPNRPLVKAAERAATRAARPDPQAPRLRAAEPVMAARSARGSVLDEVAGLLRRTLDPRIELLVEVEPGCGAVVADATLLGQAVLNLCLNARDAMPEGGRLTLSAEPRPRRRPRPATAGPGAFVRLTVADTGRGHDGRGEGPPVRAVLHHQAGRPGDRAGAGDGARASSSSTAAGWSAAARRGEGTRFDLFLPSADRRHPPAAVRPPRPARRPRAGRVRRRRPARGRPPRPRTAGGTILLVDDEDMIRDLAGRSWRRPGYAVLDGRGRRGRGRRCSGAARPTSAW